MYPKTWQRFFFRVNENEKRWREREQAKCRPFLPELARGNCGQGVEFPIPRVTNGETWTLCTRDLPSAHVEETNLDDGRRPAAAGMLARQVAAHLADLGLLILASSGSLFGSSHGGRGLTHGKAPVQSPRGMLSLCGFARKGVGNYWISGPPLAAAGHVK